MLDGLGGLTFLGGMLMGLSSGLHCAGMCGGIAATLLFAFDPGKGRMGQLRTMLEAQAGKLVVYVTAGACVAAVGTSVLGPLRPDTMHFVLRSIAAVSLGWIGLATLGLAPAPAAMDRIVGPLLLHLRPAGGAATFGQRSAPFLGGIGWGFMPCGMVFSALFYAALSGSVLRGAVAMAGFALGTMPSVTLAAFGIGDLRRHAAKPRLRLSVGIALLLVAFATVAIPAVETRLFCRH
jgi:sulfite exporter TauE/SafE